MNEPPSGLDCIVHTYFLHASCSGEWKCKLMSAWWSLQFPRLERMLVEVQIISKTSSCHWNVCLYLIAEVNINTFSFFFFNFGVCLLFLNSIPSSSQNCWVCICAVTPSRVRLLSSQHKSPAVQGQNWQGKALCNSISSLYPLGTCCLSSPAPSLAYHKQGFVTGMQASLADDRSVARSIPRGVWAFLHFVLRILCGEPVPYPLLFPCHPT